MQDVDWRPLGSESCGFNLSKPPWFRSSLHRAPPELSASRGASRRCGGHGARRGRVELADIHPSVEARKSKCSGVSLCRCRRRHLPGRRWDIKAREDEARNARLEGRARLVEESRRSYEDRVRREEDEIAAREQEVGKP